MQKKLLPYLINPYSASKSGLQIEIFEETDTRIREAILFCEDSGLWFPVHQEIAEIVSDQLISTKTKELFISRYPDFFARKSFLANAHVNEGDTTIQRIQQKQYDEFVTNSEFNYSDFESLMFWKVVDDKVFGGWKEYIKEDSCLLDVGCGNGRSSQRIYKPGLEIVGVDLSRFSILEAIKRAQKSGVYSQQTYLVADANALPFKQNVFDYVVTSGVLSQVPDPGRTCQQINDLLKSGGIYFGMENNKSVFRLAFDILVKVTGKWKKNIAGTVPEISHKMLKNWFPLANIKHYTTVFNSPTSYNALSFEEARKRLDTSDKMFYKTGFFKNQGGLIIYQIKK